MPQKNCIVKRLWEKYTPYIQLLGYMPVISGILAALWLVFSFGVGQTQAFAGLSKQVADQHDAFLTMQQEVHDIHEWMKDRQ